MPPPNDIRTRGNGDIVVFPQADLQRNAKSISWFSGKSKLLTNWKNKLRRVPCISLRFGERLIFHCSFYPPFAIFACEQAGHIATVPCWHVSSFFLISCDVRRVCWMYGSGEDCPFAKTVLDFNSNYAATLNSRLWDKWVGYILGCTSSPSHSRHHAAEVNLSITDKETSLP